MQAAGEPLKSAIVDAYADSLAPVFWYLVPILAVAFLLALALKEIPLSEFAGMVARGEAVNSEEELAALSTPATVDKVVIVEERDVREGAARDRPVGRLTMSGVPLRAAARGDVGQWVRQVPVPVTGTGTPRLVGGAGPRRRSIGTRIRAGTRATLSAPDSSAGA